MESEWDREIESVRRDRPAEAREGRPGCSAHNDGPKFLPWTKEISCHRVPCHKVWKGYHTTFCLFHLYTFSNMCDDSEPTSCPQPFLFLPFYFFPLPFGYLILHKPGFQQTGLKKPGYCSFTVTQIVCISVLWHLLLASQDLAASQVWLKHFSCKLLCWDHATCWLLLSASAWL